MPACWVELVSVRTPDRGRTMEDVIVDGNVSLFIISKCNVAAMERDDLRRQALGSQKSLHLQQELGVAY